MSNVVKIDEPNTDSSVHTRLNSHFTPFVANWVVVFLYGQQESIYHQKTAFYCMPMFYIHTRNRYI